MKRRVSKFNIFILMFILGLLVMTQWRMLGSGIRYVSFRDIEQLTQRTETVETGNLQLQDQITQLETRIAGLMESGAVEQGLEELLRQDIAYYRMASGMQAVVGPGVVVIVSDSDRQLLENEDPNNLLVHDLDIQLLIDDLKAAGAEAIAVNGQRVLPHLTHVVCNGPTIRINDEFYSQPFIIEAIGDRKFLEAAVNSPDSYAQILRQWGLFIEVDTSIYLELPGYDAWVDFNYLQIKEQTP